MRRRVPRRSARRVTTRGSTTSAYFYRYSELSGAAGGSPAPPLGAPGRFASRRRATPVTSTRPVALPPATPAVTQPASPVALSTPPDAPSPLPSNLARPAHIAPLVVSKTSSRFEQQHGGPAQASHCRSMSAQANQQTQIMHCAFRKGLPAQRLPCCQQPWCARMREFDEGVQRRSASFTSSASSTTSATLELGYTQSSSIKVSSTEAHMRNGDAVRAGRRV